MGPVQTWLSLVSASSAAVASHWSLSTATCRTSSCATFNASRYRRGYDLSAMTSGTVRQPSASSVPRYSLRMAFQESVLLGKRRPTGPWPSKADSKVRTVA